VVARNQPWVSGGVLTTNDFLGIRSKSGAYDGSQFNADDDYSHLAETARNFAAAASTTTHHGYESSYDDYQNYGVHSTSGQGQKRGGGYGASGGAFTAYGGYAAAQQGGMADVQAASQAAGRGRGRGVGATRGGSGTTSSTGFKPPQASATDTSMTYRPKVVGTSAAVGYGSAQPLVQSAARPLMEYAAAMAPPDSYTTVSAQQQQQLYEAYPGYETADPSAAAYSQAAYYSAAGGQYLTTDAAAVQQFYSQF